MQAVGQQLAAKYFDDQAISKIVDEPTLVRNIHHNNFDNSDCNNMNSITLNIQIVIENQVITISYVDQFYQEIERSRQDIGIDFIIESSDSVKNIQDDSFNDNELMKLDSITVNRNPSSDNEVSDKEYVEDSMG